MNVHQIRHRLWLSATLLTVATAATLTLGFFIPVEPIIPLQDQKTQLDKASPKAEVTAETAVDHRPSLADFAEFWAQDLRRPLYDPKPIAKAPEKKAPPLKLQLIGTLNEPGHSMAMLADNEGTISLKTIGEWFDTPGGKVEVLSITPHTVTVRYHDEPITLQLNQE